MKSAVIFVFFVQFSRLYHFRSAIQQKIESRRILCFTRCFSSGFHCRERLIFSSLQPHLSFTLQQGGTESLQAFLKIEQQTKAKRHSKDIGKKW